LVILVVQIGAEGKAFNHHPVYIGFCYVLRQSRNVVARLDEGLAHVVGVGVVRAVGEEGGLEGGIQIGVVEAESHRLVIGVQAEFQTLAQGVADVGEVPWFASVPLLMKRMSSLFVVLK
jgi:hypothetical protein